MSSQKTTIAGLMLVLITIGIYSCRYYINHNFRQIYTDVNQVIHQDVTQAPFFKVHFKNGDVGILEECRLNPNKDTLTGQGKLYNFNRNQVKEGILSFEVASIAIIETNQLEVIKSKDATRIAILSILTGANLVVGVYCLTNPKACFGSCPTFYLEGQYHLHSASAEGFSSSISPSLEKRDIDALRYSTSSSEVLITMENEALETHAVNELLLHAVPKKENEHIFHDKYGTYYHCGELFNCSSARVEEDEIGPAVRHFDELEYFSAADSFDLFSKEEIIFTFDGLPDKNLGAVLNFRQTLLTTFLLYSGLSYMGDETGDYFARLETSEQVKKRFDRPFRQLGGIRLFVWNDESRNGIFLKKCMKPAPSQKISWSPPF